MTDLINARNVEVNEIDDNQYDQFSHYQIAGLDIAINGAGQKYVEQSMRYRNLYIDKAPDFSINVTKNIMKQYNSMNPYFTQDECSYIISSEMFSELILDYSGFVLHASAIVLDGSAYLFSAPSGTGKSTHTSLWLKVFGTDRAYILNDDKPVIRKSDRTYYAFGTPWSGKSALNVNECVPLQSIAFIERATYDWIRPMNISEAIFFLMNNIVYKMNSTNLDKLIPLIDVLIRDISIYHMGCTMSENAVHMAYSTMKKG